MRVLTYLIATLVFPLFATAAESPWDTFELFRTGIEPTLAVAHLEDAKHDLRRTFEAFDKTLDAQTVEQTKVCQAYVKTIRRATADIRQTLPKFNEIDPKSNDSDNTLARTRLQLTIPTLLKMHELMETDREGGWNYLDMRSHTPCAFKDRPALKAEFKNVAVQAHQFLSGAIGAPGLIGYEDQVNRLLALADIQQAAYDRRSNILLVGTLASAIFLWEVAPALIRVAGFSPKLTTAGRVMAMMAEGTAYTVVEHVTNPEPEQRYRAQVPSLNEILSDSNGLLDSDFDEPQLYLSYVSALQAHYASLLGQWLPQHLEALKRTAKHEEAVKLAVTLWLAREAASLMDLTPEKAALRVRQSLMSDWQVQSACGVGQIFSGTSTPQCLIGVRRLARMFYQGSMPRLKPELAEVLRFDITNATVPRVTADESTVTVHLPYTLKPEAYADFINGMISSRSVRKRLKLMAEYNRALKLWNDADVARIEFDDNLGVVDRWRALRNLQDLANEDAELFDRPAETIYISHQFKTTFERRMELQESVDARASIGSLRKFLIAAKADERAIAPVRTYVETMRTKINAVGAELKANANLQFDCSKKSTLMLDGCLRTLKRVSAYAKRMGGLDPTAAVVVVMSRLETDQEFDLFQTTENKQTVEYFTVQEGFDTGRLHAMAHEHLWLKAR